MAHYIRKRPENSTSDNNNLIFGIHPVLEALNSQREIEKILVKTGLSGTSVQEILHIARQKSVPVQLVPQEKLDGLARSNHQGVIALISALRYRNFDELVKEVIENEKNPFFILLDGITDVRNFGAIARSAVCFGAHGIIFPGKGSAQGNAEAVKSSAGALNHIPVCRVESLLKSITHLKENGIRVIGLSEKAPLEINNSPLTEAIAIVLGSEGEGISAPVLKWCDVQVRIPMLGKISSLNVSAAAAVCFYELARQRNNLTDS
jgi:23S rRNA (guanosine2251-2'-O)-methyltransferase